MGAPGSRSGLQPDIAMVAALLLVKPRWQALVVGLSHDENEEMFGIKAATAEQQQRCSKHQQGLVSAGSSKCSTCRARLHAHVQLGGAQHHSQSVAGGSTRATTAG